MIVDYESELFKLQAELVDLQQWVAKHKSVSVYCLKDGMLLVKEVQYDDLLNI